MTSPMMQHFPLTHAYLCQDCNRVGNCAMQCPACASTALLGLATVLNREEERDVVFTLAEYEFASEFSRALAA